MHYWKREEKRRNIHKFAMIDGCRSHLLIAWSELSLDVTLTINRFGSSFLLVIQFAVGRYIYVHINLYVMDLVIE